MSKQATGDGNSASKSAYIQRFHRAGCILIPLRAMGDALPNGGRASGKEPVKRGWQKVNCSPPIEECLGWVGNYGILPGPSNLAVLDVEPAGLDAFPRDRIPQGALIVGTPSGGYHAHLDLAATEHVLGRRLNKKLKLGAKAELHTFGSQVLGPGSHAYSEKAQREGGYSIEQDGVPISDETVLGELLAPIIDDEAGGQSSRRKVAGPDSVHPESVSASRTTSYGRKVLESAVVEIASAVRGTKAGGGRHDVFIARASKVYAYVAGGVIAEAEAQVSLHAAYTASMPDELHDMERCLRDARRYGFGEPRALPQRGRKDGAAAGRCIPPKCKVAHRNRAVIQIQGGRLHETVDLAEAALQQSGGDPIFQRKDPIVRVIRLNEKARTDGITRHAGALIIRPVDTTYLIERLTASASFVKFDARSNEWVAKDCPKAVAETYLARVSNWRLPVLAGVVRGPTLRADGSVVNEAGYDSPTGIYLDPAGLVRVPLPERPTKDDAVAALTTLQSPFHHFPFVEQSDLATLISAVLTALVRKSLRTAPLHLFRAPMPGSGKTLLADIVGLIATGIGATMITPGEDEEENAKRILAILVDGDEVVCFDNIVGTLESRCLCAVLTSDEFKGRLLGLTKNVHSSTRNTWLGTGNNVVVVGDLTRRVLPCDIDPTCEHPEQRQFDDDLRRQILARRSGLVGAGLTILRAYILAGRPGQGLSSYGSFEEWSDLVRAAIVWAGGADACDGRGRLQQVDPVRGTVRTVFRAWQATIGFSAVTARDAIKCAESDASKLLLGALSEIPRGRERTLDSRALGNWLSDRRGWVDSGLRIVHAGDRQGSALWQLVEARGSGGVGGTSPTHHTETVSQAVNSSRGARDPRESPNPPSPCCACSGSTFWRLRDGPGDWGCTRCHPPLPSIEAIETVAIEEADHG